MKRNRFFSLTAFVAITAVAAFSCSREKASVTPEPVPGDEVEISLRGDFEDFETRASIKNIFRMTWTAGDVVDVYGKASGADAFSHLGTLTASLVAGTEGRVADLTGSITAPASGEHITFIYSPNGTPTLTGGNITVDLKTQGGKSDSVTFVAYSSVVYSGATATYRESFKFATGVLRVNVSELPALTVLNKAEIDSLNTVCRLTLSTGTAPTVTGTTRDTITKTFTGSPAASQYGSTFFYIAIPQVTADATCHLTLNDGEDSKFISTFSSKASGKTDALINLISVMTEVKKYKVNSVDYGYGIYIPETGVYWAPLNCGYTSTLTYGLLYQFGRKVGTSYGKSWTSPSSHSAEANPQEFVGWGHTNPADNRTYQGAYSGDWYSGDPKFLEWPMKSGDIGYLENKIDNPCPSGWRLPTYAELNELIGRDTISTGFTLQTYNGMNGHWFDGKNAAASENSGIFLPVSGARNSGSGEFYGRGTDGNYWSSSIAGTGASLLHLEEGRANMSIGSVRGGCYSVRCVQE